MVSLMRRIIFFALALMAPAHAALEVKIDKTRSQLGEPLVLQISSSEDLSALDLSPLSGHFELASQTLNRVSNQGRDKYLLETTLYPLRSGVLVIPSLALGTQRSRALSIRVTPANVLIRAWFPPDMPMAREATILHLEIRDDGSVSWDTQIQIDAPYTMIRTLPEAIRDETRDGIKHKVHHLRWQILPLKEGSVTVRFGMLDAHRYGQRLRYPVGNVSLRVRPTPAYLPLRLPIGRVYVRSDPRPRHVNANKLQTWNMYVQAPGLSAEGLQSLLQYNVPAGVVFYPPNITSVMLGADEYLRLSLSFKADRSARMFPEIRLPYFDVRTQRIETITLPASQLHVRDLARERLLAWGIVIMALCLLIIVFWKSWQYRQRRATKHQWLSQILAAQTPSELYIRLTRHAPWRARTLRDLPAMLNIDVDQYAELDALRFGRMDINRFPSLKANLVHLVAETSAKRFPQSFLHR